MKQDPNIKHEVKEELNVIPESPKDEVLDEEDRESLKFNVGSEEEDIPEEENPKIKKKFLDYNLSWAMLIIDIALILTLGTFNIQQAYTEGSKIPAINSTLYTFVIVIASVLFYFLAYVGGKIVGGIIGGYELTKIKFLGFTIVFGRKGSGQTKTGFRITDAFDLRLIMSPKEGKKQNHYLHLLGGMIGYILLSIIALIVALVAFESGHWLQISLLYSLGYGFLIALYQLFPCRLDYDNDCFTLIRTRNLDDREAYNLELRNIRHDLLNEDLEVATFSDYESYYKSHTLYYNYLNSLYSNKLDEAVNILAQMKALDIHYGLEQIAKINSEELYLLLITDSFSEAERVYGDLNRDYKKQLTSSLVLSDFRAALLITCFIDNSLDDTNEVLANLQTFLDSSEEVKSNRFTKELSFIKKAIKKVKSSQPDWDLNIPEALL